MVQIFFTTLSVPCTKYTFGSLLDCSTYADCGNRFMFMLVFYVYERDHLRTSNIGDMLAFT